MITLIPAYGRDYRSARAVKKALQSQIDFRVQDVSSKWDGMVGNLLNIKTEGYEEVKVRYSKLRKVTIFKTKDL
tara:strand:+ start:56 stop:277 length:222 start_codon:yes stop_codon:yes gene_type:complete